MCHNCSLASNMFSFNIPKPWQGWWRGVTDNSVLQLYNLRGPAKHLPIGFYAITI